ncbi:MAG: hypothetical protein FWC51_00730, partial [Proteobacteria bacterium]|nr:hypothetical protein [Pseudomonadota bacterium]
TRPPRGAGKGRKYAPLHILVQIGIDGVRLFAIDAAAQRRMKKAGWEFVNVGANENSPISWAQHVAPLQFLTCVGFAKRAMGMHAPFVWTPDQLYKKLSRCDNFL